MDVRWDFAGSTEDARAWADSTLIPAFTQYGFREEQRSADSVLLLRKRTAWWLAIFSVIAFWLSPDARDRVFISFTTTSETSTRIAVSGDLPGRLRRILLDIPGSTAA